MIALKKRLQNEIARRLADAYPLPASGVEMMPTPDRAFGDLALNLPFQLARAMKKNPRALAQEILPRLAGLPGIGRAEIAGAGYINLYLDRAAFLASRLAEPDRSELSPEERKIVVEHTNINPNKAAHIGHLRNACLGDVLVRCLRRMGETVEVQNYIDDTGVQVVDVVYGFLELEKKTPAEVAAIPGKFDYYCWDLYARVSAHLAADPGALARRGEILKRIEHGEGEEAALARHVSRRIVRAHLATMKRLGVAYDVLPCESSILQLRFWDQAFTLLKDRGAISLAGEGENKGCWIMRLEDEADREKVIVRSDGTVTYVGKDIAYQMWKFGLLGRDFNYEPFLEEDGRTVWISTPEPRPGGPEFGRASRVYNVIDTRQAYLQKVVVQGLRALHYEAQAAKSIHFSYEMVALSPASLAELGYAVKDEEKDRAFLEVSGRKGLGVKADDLLDRLEEKALAEVGRRNPAGPEDANLSVARAIARGALRYFMLKFARNSLIVFDFEEALSFEGETGPYLQYAGVRLASLFRKLHEREGVSEADVLASGREKPAALDRLSAEESNAAWDLVLSAAGLDEEVRRSVAALEFSHLAKFAFALCQKFNSYYHVYPVLGEGDPEVRRVRLLTLALVAASLRRALDLMGIPLPERM